MRVARAPLGIAAAVILTLLAGWIAWPYARKHLLASKGFVISIDSKSKNVNVSAGERATAEFEISNLMGRPVTILGASTKCGCALVSDLPATIPAGGSHKLRFSVSTKADDGDSVISQEATLFLDEPSPVTTLRVNVAVGSR